MHSVYDESLDALLAAARASRDLSADVKRAAETISAAIKSGCKLMVAGNGGSAAQSQHIAAEFIVRFDRHLIRGALPALALTSDQAVLTALGNDFVFADIFARQVEALGRCGDVLLLISTSGDSLNLLEAARRCGPLNVATIALLGQGGGKLSSLVDLPIIVPAGSTARIQEIHLLILHSIIGEVERSLS